MQTAQTALLDTIRGLIEENELDKALEALRALDQQTRADIWQDVAQQSGNYKQAAQSFQRGLISFEEYSRFTARTRYALLELMKEIPGRIERNAQVRSLSTFQFQVPDNTRLEKVIGAQSTLLRVNWLEKALQAARAVCRIVCADGTLGTGFLTREGYVFTNNHVIGSPEVAATARIEFNYEIDPAGNVRQRTEYELDASDFITSTPGELDFARIRVRDRSDAPLNQWGFVEFDTSVTPAVGDAVTIIQHPQGEDKQIALKANDVVGVWNQHVFYTTDTEPGSSGSPVFNRDWKVIAIHHAGRTDAEGGLQINERGDRRGANRGVLFREIFKFIGAPQARAGLANVPMPDSESGVAPRAELVLPKESTEKAGNPMPLPVAEAPAPINPPPLKAVPKFVVIYDVADEPHAQLLNRHLNVLKITKRIVVYNVHSSASAGEDVVTRARQELSDADYLLCLVSVNLFNSPDWFEMILEAMNNQRRVIPIHVENADIEGTGLEKLKGLPTLNRVVKDFPQADAAYKDIVEELKKLLPRP